MYMLKKNKPKWLIRNNVSEEPSSNVGLVKGEHRDGTVKQATVRIFIYRLLSFSYLIWRFL
jgi:hypothetical protein